MKRLHKIPVFLNLIKTPLIIGAVLGLIIGNIIVIQELSDQGREDNERAKTSREEIQKLIKETNDHLDCIVEYFTNQDRSGLYIESVENCRLKRRVSSVSQESSIVKTPVIPTTPKVAVQSSPQPTQSTSRTREQDRSFLDCSTKELRKRLKKSLDKEMYKRVCR